MSYFTDLANASRELDQKAQAYLDQFKFLPNDIIINRIIDAAKDLYERVDGDWDQLPDWAAAVMDGHIPYTDYKNGSIGFALGFSVVSRDAHLRNLLEIAEGRTSVELDFPVVAEVKGE